MNILALMSPRTSVSEFSGYISNQFNKIIDDPQRIFSLTKPGLIPDNNDQFDAGQYLRLARKQDDSGRGSKGGPKEFTAQFKSSINFLKTKYYFNFCGPMRPNKILDNGRQIANVMVEPWYKRGTALKIQPR